VRTHSIASLAGGRTSTLGDGLVFATSTLTGTSMRACSARARPMATAAAVSASGAAAQSGKLKAES